MNNSMMAFSFQLKPGDKILTTKQMEEQYGWSATTQCRRRRQGNGPEFIDDGGKVLYVERVVQDWFSERTYKSTAEIPANVKGKRYAHLAQAQQKGVAAKKAKQAAKVSN